MLEQQGFVLTRQWRDTRQGVELEFWLSAETGPVKLIVPAQKAVFFIPADQASTVDTILQHYRGCSRKELTLCDFFMRPVVAYYFSSQRSLRKVRDMLLVKGLTPLESDVNPYDRFLMERFVRGAMRFRGEAFSANGVNSIVNPIINPNSAASDYQPQLKVLSLDIETSMQDISLYSIGLYAQQNGRELRKVFMVSDSHVAATVEVFSGEKQLLNAFLDWLGDYDPDIIIGWSVVNFDMWFLERVCQKHRLPFRCGRGNSVAHWRTLGDGGDRRAVSIPGRVVLDGIELLKAATYQFESFSLHHVARELLGDSKLIVGSDRGEKIAELFQNNKQALADYNIQDCKLVWDIFNHANLLEFSMARSRLTGLPLDRIGGSVAAFDFRYLPLLHREGFVAPNGHLSDNIERSPGGFVMNSQPGIYDHVVVLDFKSLYPSIIRSFNIDPMGMAIGLHKELDQTDLVPGFNGAWFAKHKNLLPGIITELWQSRDRAKANKDAPLSQAIKIIMNSFYGVLGSSGCRFFDSRLASSITRRGHQIIQQTADYIEQQGWPVIYGDTDSVFIWLKDIGGKSEAEAVGHQLEKALNQWWQKKLQKEYAIESALDIEFETHYQRFLMPTVRGSDQGSKKRYAGVVMADGQEKLVFKGLETVRSDWTRLAREFQSELYRRVFFNEPYHDYLKQVVQQVLRGEHDDVLIYRKRLRRKLEDYKRNIPPHVQAARKAVMAGEDIRRGDWVEYIITVSGAEPLVAQSSLIDYQHYIDRQLAPVADGILYFLGDSLANITDQQINLFH
ncbi:MAG: DNA polymerase II [Pseudomonadales bacterium]